MSLVGALLGPYRWPHDPPTWTAMAMAVACLVWSLRRPRRAPTASEARALVALAACTAAALSAAYVALYLRGAPRIIDATSYLAQARIFARGAWTALAPLPSASVRGRFLVFHDGAVASLFPPGWPLALSLACRAGAPLAMGPAIGAALVLATASAARELTHLAGAPPSIARRAATLAAWLSVVSGALRYHTADTMAHGAAALLLTLAFTALLRARRATRWDSRWLAISGLALGALAATRPVSAMAPLAFATFALARRPPSLRSLAAFAAALAPAIALLLLYQWRVTGSPWLSPQLAYYAAADGPPGCFRYGFGEGIGCLHEHGDFVAARLPDGYGAAAAIGVTARRLHLHLGDILNFEALAGLVLVGAWAERRAGRLVLAWVAAHIAAYAPFYFDGNYPGGGARLLADVIPLEHALIALTVSRMRRSTALPSPSLALVAVALVALATHAAPRHEQLRDRELGRPMHVAAVTRPVDDDDTVVFFDTDHGFNLAWGAGRLLAARRHGDARDRIVLEESGRTRAFVYVDDEESGPRLDRYDPPPRLPSARLELEAEWPALSQHAALARPRWTDGCASRGRALEVAPMVEHAAGSAVVELPVAEAGAYCVTPTTVGGDGLGGEGALVLESPERREVARWSWSSAAGCHVLEPRLVALARGSATMRIEARGGSVAVDAVALTRRDPSSSGGCPGARFP